MPQYRVVKDSFVNNHYVKAGATVTLPDTHPDGKKFEVSDNFAVIGSKEDKKIVTAIKNEELMTEQPKEIVKPLEAEESLV